MQSSAMEPRCGVHRDVAAAHWEVYHNVVCRKHLIDTGDAHTLGTARSTRGIEAYRLIIYIIRCSDNRFVGGGILYEVVV